MVFSGATPLTIDTRVWNMVVETERDDITWYRCEECGLMMEDREEAKQHEANCDAEEPSYIQ